MEARAVTPNSAASLRIQKEKVWLDDASVMAFARENSIPDAIKVTEKPVKKANEK